MPVFVYHAHDDKAIAIEDTISADSPRAARDFLRSRGLTVERITEQTESPSFSWLPFRRRGKFAAKRIEMVRELSTLLGAGIPLLESLDSLVAQQEGNFGSKAFRESLLMVRERVSAGANLTFTQPDYSAPSASLRENLLSDSCRIWPRDSV